MFRFTGKVHAASDPQPQVEERNEEKETMLPIVFSKKYSVKFCGLEKLHPFDSAKGHHIYKILERQNFITSGKFYEPTEITKQELLKVHTKKYLRSLKWSINAARISEIPLLILVPNVCVQRGYLRPMRFQTAGSILAGKLALLRGWAINLGGGFHHCCSYKGAGFCAYADITLLVMKVLEEENTVRKVMIVDLDAHQGNGHEHDFRDVSQVYIMDVYNKLIYPRDEKAKKSIRYAIELNPHTRDEVYLPKLKFAFRKSLRDFKPDFVVYNAGTDILRGDPLGLLDITPEGVIARDLFIFSTCRTLFIPIVMLLSGGYLRSSAQVIADSIQNLKNSGLF